MDRSSRKLWTPLSSALLTTVVLAQPLATTRVASAVAPAAFAAEAPGAIHAAGRGEPWFRFRDGGASVPRVRVAGAKSVALDNLQPRALESIDLDRDGAPDLVSGYADGAGGGALIVQRGNPDAFAPKDVSVYARMRQGYDPDALLPDAVAYRTPEPPDFVAVGDFDHDGSRDVVAAARGGDLFLLAGDGAGGLAPARRIALPGAVTALAAGEFGAADGWTDLAVGVSGADGAALLVFDGLDGLDAAPKRWPLEEAPSAVALGEVDASPFLGAAVAEGVRVSIVHGWGRKTSPALSTRIETIARGAPTVALSSGFFVWNRAASKQLAALGADGVLRVLARGRADERPFGAQELDARAQLKRNAHRDAIDVESLSGWRADDAERWVAARQLAVDAGAAGAMLRSHLSFLGTDELVVLRPEAKRLTLVRHIDADAMGKIAPAVQHGDLAAIELDAEAAPVAAIGLPQKMNGERTLVVLQAGRAAATLVPLAPTATITVDRFDDPSGAALTAASACTGAASDCSLRGAVQFANAAPGTVITLPVGTIVLNINGTGGCIKESTSTGNTIGDLEVNTSTTINGAGAGSSIVRQIGTGNASFPGDRVFCLNVPFTVGLNYSFSGFTFTGGRDVNTNFGGGGLIGGEKDNTLTLNNMVVSNNQGNGSGLGGGGIQITGGSMTVNNSTIGAANAPGANRSDATLSNSIGTSGGGISFSPGSPTGLTPSTGIFTSSGTTFLRNVANSAAAGGGGADLYAHNLGTGSANIGTTTFSNNQAPTGSGAGFILESTLATTVSNSAFNSNSAGNRGGGIYLAGGTLLLDGTAPTITFSGNTAPGTGTSISAAGAVTVSGTNTTIGGSIEVTTNGSWTNNPGSTLSPTDVNIVGAPFTCSSNSTMNVAGNLNITTGAVVGATFTANASTVNIGGNFLFTAGGSSPATTFNAGTGTFNFNGAGAQSIGNTAAITFNNLTVSNTAQPLTLNNSLAVNGALSVANSAVLAPVAAAVVSGSGTLSGSGTVRVSRTVATPSFLGQYTIAGTSLANLTVEYAGAAAQSVDALTYGGLRLNNASGATLAGATVVNGGLTLSSGALGVGSNALTINAANSATAGTLTSAANGTVTYGQGSNGQSVLTANYGNLAFSGFNKVLPAATIGVAGTFTPGAASGHTIAGNTIDFNGAGAQTVPAFNYNGLTISGARGAASVTLASGGIGVAGVFTPSASFAGGGYVKTGNTIDFNGAGSQTVPAFNYNGLTISGARGAASVTLAGGSIGVAGTFTPGASFAGGGYLVTGNTFDFNGAGAQTVPVFDYNNLSISGARGGATLTLGAGTIGVTGAFAPTATSVVYASAGNAVAFVGVAAQSIPAFTFNDLTLNNAAGATLAGAVTVNGALGLTAGLLTTGANTLSIGASGTRSRVAGYVVGNELKTFAGPGSFTFDLGTAGAGNYSPLDATVTAGSGTLTAKATATAQPNLTVAQQARALHRFWTLTGGGAGVTANLVFSYLAGDVNGTESFYRIIKVSGGVPGGFGNQCPSRPCVDIATRRLLIDGVSSFSDWTAADINPDLTLAKSHAGNFIQGDVGRAYTLTLTNAGDLPVDAVTRSVTDTLPAGLTPSGAAGTGWSCGVAAQTATCTRSDALAAGASDPAVTVTVNVAANAPALVVNSASGGGGGEANAANDGASDSTTILANLLFADGFE